MLLRIFFLLCLGSLALSCSATRAGHDFPDKGNYDEQISDDPVEFSILNITKEGIALIEAKNLLNYPIYCAYQPSRKETGVVKYFPVMVERKDPESDMFRPVEMDNDFAPALSPILPHEKIIFSVNLRNHGVYRVKFSFLTDAAQANRINETNPIQISPSDRDENTRAYRFAVSQEFIFESKRSGD